MSRFTNNLIRQGGERRGNWAYFDMDVDSIDRSHKIFISADKTNYSKIYNRLRKHFHEYKVPFKIISSLELLEKTNDGEFGKNQIGKFITLYPQVGMAQHLDGLLKVLRNYQSPKIQSGTQYYGSIIYYEISVIQTQEVPLPIPKKEIIIEKLPPMWVAI